MNSRAIEHALSSRVVAEDGRAGDFVRDINASQGLADEAVLAGGFERYFMLWYLPPLSAGYQLPVADSRPRVSGQLEAELAAKVIPVEYNG